MFRKVFYLLLVFTLIAFMVSCSKSDKSESESTTQVAGQRSAAPEAATQYAGNIRLTGLQDYGRYAKTITLNNVIEIKNVKIQEGRRGKFVAFPRRQAGDRWYDYVNLSDRSLGDVLLDAVENSKISEVDEETTLDITDVKVRKHDSGNLKGFVEVLIDNSIWLKSLQLRDGKHGLWVAYPRHQKEFGDDKGEWENLIEVSDPLKKAIQDKVIAVYKSM